MQRGCSEYSTARRAEGRAPAEKLDLPRALRDLAAAGAAAGRRHDRIHHDGGDVDAQVREGGAHALALAAGQQARPRDDDEASPVAVGEESAQAAQRPRQLEELGGELAEPDGAPVL